MFSSALVNLFVSRIRENYSTDFHKIRWKGGTWATEERRRRRRRRLEERRNSGGNPDHVTLRLGYGHSYGYVGPIAIFGMFYPAFV